jgi:ATP-dependent DNA helicase RecG
VIAPVFKLLGIIDQWGNGLKLIADELKAYPEIEFRWKEVGLSFQVQFVKRNFKAEIESRQEFGQELGQELRQELRQERKEKTMFTFILIHLQQESLSRSELANALGLKTISGHLNRTIAKLKEHGLIEFTIPDKPNHPDQKFRITERGIVFIELVKK